MIVCVDEFGPLNLQPHPGRQWAPVAAGRGDTGSPRRRRRRANYTRPHGVRHLLAAYDLSADRLYGHITTTKDRPAFQKFLRHIRSLHPGEVRIGIVLHNNFSPHVSKDIAAWAEAHNIELAFVPFYASWLNRIEAQFDYFDCRTRRRGHRRGLRRRVGRNWVADGPVVTHPAKHAVTRPWAPGCGAYWGVQPSGSLSHARSGLAIALREP